MQLMNVLLLASSASAFALPDASSVLPLFARLARGGGGKDNDSGSGNTSNTGNTGTSGNSRACPAVWTTVSAELTANFLTGGQCNPNARAAIRQVSHDCGAWNTAQGAKGGCDGSLILAGEINRAENNGLQAITAYTQSLATKYKVAVADMIVFMGNHAIATCPGGPQVQTFIGRKDSTTPAPNGLLPDVNAPAAVLFQLFQDKGFSAVDLAALVGAHTSSNQFHVNMSAAVVGEPQDSTPGVWDVKFYSDTYNAPKGVFVFPSDAKLSVHPTVGKEFQGFVNNQGKWNGKFADAMARMTLFGVAGTTGMADCTSALPKITNSKREMRAMPMFASRH